jgi:hypothetical protein
MAFAKLEALLRKAAVRFAGSRPLARDLKLGYIASVARQSDYARNPNRYAASYWLGEASLTARVLSATAGYEVLGADKFATDTDKVFVTIDRVY